MKTTILYDENLIIKLPKKMKQDIQEISKNNNQTVSEYVRSLIANEIRKN
jgi:predicted DNA-binding protein